MAKRKRTISGRTSGQLPMQRPNTTQLTEVPAAGLAAPPPDAARNEQFDICCFYMGQGDCSLIRCPDGNLIMIDCGSTGDFPLQYKEIAMNLVRDVNWAGPTMHINALILTHSDRDHYNQVGYVLGETSTSTRKYLKLEIDKIYCSDALVEKRDSNGHITAMSPLGNYTESGLSDVVYNGYFGTPEIQEVTICSGNDNNNFYRKWNSNDNFHAWTTTPIANRKYTIFSGTTPGTAAAGPKQWSVSLIAGNVPKVAQFADLGDNLAYADGASEDNARSLITLLEIGPKKLLFCGDATFSTERFLLQNQLAPISNVDFVLAPHHGSEWASCQPFVDAINPRQGVVSCGYMEHSYKHPRQAAIQKWLGKVNGLASFHGVDYWTVLLQNGAETIEGILNHWGTQGWEIEVSKSGSFKWLLTLPADASAPYGVSWTKGFGLLFRADTDRDFQETAFAVDPNAPPGTPGQFLNYKIG